MTMPPTANRVIPVGPVLGILRAYLTAGNPPGGGPSWTMGMSLTDCNNKRARMGRTMSLPSDFEARSVFHPKHWVIHETVIMMQAVYKKNSNERCSGQLIYRCWPLAHLHSRSTPSEKFSHFSQILRRLFMNSNRGVWQRRGKQRHSEGWPSYQLVSTGTSVRAGDPLALNSYKIKI